MTHVTPQTPRGIARAASGVRRQTRPTGGLRRAFLMGENYADDAVEL